MDTLYIIDIDGVIFNFLDAFLNYVNSVMDVHVTKADITEPGFDKFPIIFDKNGEELVDHEEWVEIFQEFEQQGGYCQLEPMPAVKPALATIFNSGALVVLLTARDIPYSLDTFHSLVAEGAMYDLVHFAVWDKAAFLKRSQYKGRFKRIVMIEDQARNLFPCSPYIDKGYLIAWPHNADIEELPTNIERVTGWGEILQKEGLA